MNFGIIAAGEGSRLKFENANASKPLITVNGTPLIERLFTLAEENGFDSISCIINEESNSVKEYISNRKFKIPFNLVIKSTPSSLHSFYSLAPYLKERPFCLTTVDSIFNQDEFIEFINNSIKEINLDGILAVTDFIDDEKPLCIETDENMNIKSLYDNAEGHKYATGGIYFFRTDVFTLMEKAINENVMRLRNFLKLLLQNNYKIKAFPFSKIIDIDHLKDLQVAEEYINSLNDTGN